MRLRTYGWALGTACSLLACGGKERPGPYQDALPNPNVPHDRLPEQSDDFVELRCPTRVPDHESQCGKVTVPLGPGSDETIDIFVARVFSNAATVQPDPVVYLDGGPGAASVGAMGEYYATFSRAAPDRDLIFIDQRGVGRSIPALTCPDRGTDPFDATENCYRRLSADWDLQQFSSSNNARDVDGVRQAFGYESWNLWGISYGTRLALTILRDHPQGVRSVILDGVVPLEADLLGEVGLNGFRALEEVHRTCLADPDCAIQYPDPLGQLIAVVEKLNGTPAQVGAIQVYGNDVLSVVFQALYSPLAVAYIPLMIDTLANEDYSLFERVGEAVGGSGIAYGMHLSLQCAEEVAFSSAEAYAAFDAQVPMALREGLSGAYYIELCRRWAVAPASPRENQPVMSATPTLVSAGQFDPITPGKYSAQVHQNLANSQYFFLAGESHGASAGECGVKMVGRFLNDPGADASEACATNVPELDFQSTRGPSAAGTHKIIGGALDMRTSPPNEQEWAEIVEDLKRRLHHR